MGNVNFLKSNYGRKSARSARWWCSYERGPDRVGFNLQPCTATVWHGLSGVLYNVVDIITTHDGMVLASNHTECHYDTRIVYKYLYLYFLDYCFHIRDYFIVLFIVSMVSVYFFLFRIVTKQFLCCFKVAFLLYSY